MRIVRDQRPVSLCIDVLPFLLLFQTIQSARIFQLRLQMSEGRDALRNAI
jgi:hypothetical protein